MKLKFSKEKQSMDIQIRSAVSNFMSETKRENYSYFKELIIFIIWLCLGICIYVMDNQTLEVFYISYFLLGVFNALVFLNIIHDAAHNVLFQNKRYNRAAFNLLNIIGGCTYIWYQRHVVLHHLYPNVVGKDLDIKQSGIVRITGNDNFYSINRYQHYYMPLLYLGYTLYWLLIRDIRDLANPKQLGLKKITTKQLLTFVSYKVLYVFLFILFPYFLSEFAFYEILTGFIIMHFSQSLIASLSLLTAHVSEESLFLNLEKENKIPFSWMELQILTTSDFATNNRIVNFLFGGFNYHLAHHLFPNISNRYYKRITPIIKKIVESNGLKYNHAGLSEALLSHWKLLRRNSKKDKKTSNLFKELYFK